ncbi:alpha-glucan family phosphorylase [Candidatus Sumerlaeota bacterium]|nr:alpha-glucan family phosphorylase [Candidatus Sumerlaeota bacterium]
MRVNAFTVVPSLPESLKRLDELARNMYWCWDPEILALFVRLDRDLWNTTYHNPIKMLGSIRQERLDEISRDDGFLSHLERACRRFDNYTQGNSWFQQAHGNSGALTVGYFSAEFGISETLPIYSGGLGVLSGDHVKASSDLGLPLVGVGLLYRQGYFRQYLNADGWQQEIYPENDFYNLPVVLLRNPDNSPLTIQVDFPDRAVAAQVWQVAVGRIKVLLLDTNLTRNRPEDREISAQLYGGDQDTRIKQEIVMGIGGIRALEAAGIHADVFHMNEGHSAFLGLERIRGFMAKYSVSFETALEAVRAGNVFTTHTPVAAGNDSFPASMAEYYFRDYVQNHLKIDTQAFLGLGRQNPQDRQEPFCMTVLALNLAANCNGVSKLHGKVSRGMWRRVWPGVPVDEVPIASITNGVHIRSWISQEMATLYDRYLGPRWAENPEDESVWTRADEIPDAELWRTHERRRERLVAFARRSLRNQLLRRGEPENEVRRADEVLDPEVLTIGFARRFALYKRGALLLRDAERIKKILTDKTRPVQFIFAGKAHPADHSAKEIIRQLIHFMRDPDVRRHVTFIEDYDMNIARYLLQGVDVWLNTPRRPLEASGTSGMKAAANGALNLSILDGWWCEGYDPSFGWAIGQGEEYKDVSLEDDIQSAAIYDLLEKEIVPTFYQRGADGLPREWIRRMRASIQVLCPGFSATRMLRDYLEGPYMSAAAESVRLVADNLKGAAQLADFKKRMKQHWSEIQVRDLVARTDSEIGVGEEMPVEATIQLGGIEPTDVLVQIYHGPLSNKEEILDGRASDLEYKRSVDGVHVFAGAIRCESSGRYGFAVRVLPRHDAFSSPFESRLIYWA